MHRALLVCNAVFPLEPVRLPKLFGPVRDGLAMWSALTDPEVGLFAPENVEVLFDCEKDEIFKAAERFFSRCGTDDVLLFYYSGHGKKGRSNVQLCARDTILHDQLMSTSFSGADLKDMMDTSPARSRIVVLDCCHSGAFKGTAPQVSPELLAGKGRFVITASGAGETAVDAEKEGVPSPFTRVLVEALREARPRSAGSGSVAVEDVYDYTLTAMPAGYPRPRRSITGSADAVIARRPGRSPGKGAAIPSTAEQGVPAGASDLGPPGFLTQGLPVLGRGGPQARQSLGDRLAWRMILLVSLLAVVFSMLSRDAWQKTYVQSSDEDFFFLGCGGLAILSALWCAVEALVPATSRRRGAVRVLRLLLGLGFGVLWLCSVLIVGLNYDEQTLLQGTLAFLGVATVAQRAHDALFLAGAVVCSAGVFAPTENLGFGDFDASTLLQALCSALMMIFWYFRATDRQYAVAAAISLLPATVSFLVHGDVPGLSLYGAGLALVSALLGDGTRPAEGKLSPIGRALSRFDGAET